MDEQLPEVIKWAFGGGSLGVVVLLGVWLFKRFIEKEIIEPIDELQKDNKEIKNSFIKFTENINSFIFRILNSHVDTAKTVDKNLDGMNQLFTEATRHTSQAKLEAHEALQKVNALAETTDKLVTIATKVHEKNDKLESRVQRISDDLVMVKTKIEEKKK